MPNVALIAGNLVSDSGVEVSAINAQNYARKHSARDFPNGTLIETTIDYSVTNGDPFVLEITGNSYGALVPFNMAYQGYIYNNTTINHGGISTGAAITGMSLFNYNGKLCFWFPSQAYWQGFNVYVYIADTGFRENKVTNITNVAKPAGITKEISMTFQQVVRASSASVGTTNYVAKFTGNAAVGDSQIIDNGTDIGIGVVPLATTLGKSLSIGSAGNGLLSYDVGNTYLTQNTYYNGAWKYANNAAASQYILFGGEHLFYTAPSGTAGTNVTLTERMRITSGGNVGIGTSSPSSKLHISTASGAIFEQITSGTNQMYLGYDVVGAVNSVQSNSTLTFNTGASFTERLRITSSGDVGIGTTSPSYKLHIVQNTTAGRLNMANIDRTSAALIRVTNPQYSADASSGIMFRVFPDTDARQGAGLIASGGSNNGSTDLDLFVTASPDGLGGTSFSALRIRGFDGNVGIGTTTPATKLDVNGIIRVSTTDQSTNRFRLFNQNSGQTWDIIGGLNGANNTDFSIYDGSNTRFVITSSGNVGIGTTSPTQKLDVNGTTSIFGTGSADTFIILRGFNSGGTRFQTNSGFSSAYNGLGITTNYTNANSLPAWNFDFGGQDGINFLADAFTVWRRPSGGSYSNFFTITSAGNVGIGTTNPGSMINSGAFFKPETAGEHLDIFSPSNEAVINLRSNRDTNGGQVGGIYFTRDAGQGDAHRHIGAIQVRQGGTGALAGGSMLFFTKPTNSGLGVDAARMVIDSAGGITIPALGGTGTRIVTADANGFLAASTLSSSIVGGSGTTNYVAKFTASGTVGNSQIFDNSVYVRIGTSADLNLGLFALQTDGGTNPHFAIYSPSTSNGTRIILNDNINSAEIRTIPGTSLTFRTNGLERVRITSDGNVGINTSSPSTRLHVVGNILGEIAGGYQVQIYPAWDTGLGGIGTSTNTGLVLATNSVERMRITTGGNVGIGTLTPNTRLDVVATKNTTGLRLSPSAASAANDYTQIGVGNPGADVDYASIRFTYENGLSNWYNTAISFHTFARFPGNALLERMRINGDGYVGIATSNPLNFLDVYSNNRTSLTAVGGGINVNYTGNTTGQFSTIGFSWAQSIDGATRWGMGLTGTSFASGLADLFFFNGGVERMRITSAGNIGIGTTSGVTGKLTISSSLGDQIKLDRTGQTSRGIVISAADNLSIGTWVDPTQVSITPSGNVGIGTTGPSKKLVVAAPPPTFSGDDGIIVTDPATANQTYLARCGSTYTYRAVPPNAGMLYSNTDLSLLADSGYAITFHTSSGHVARLTAAGNFGIGTTSPTQKLEVHGDILIENGADSVSKLIISNGGGGNAEIIGSEADGILRIKNGNSGVPIIHFLNSGDSVMMAINNSNVGIGTTTPQAILETYKSAGTTDFVGLRMHNYDASSRNTSSTSVSFFVGATQERARITAGNPDDFSGANGFLTFSTRISESVTEKMRITSGGNVGIGTTSPTERLDVRTTVVRDPSSGEAHAAFYTNAAQSIDRGASITLGGGINNAGTSVTNFATISGLKENSTENNTAGTLSFWTRVNAGPMTRKMTITSDGNVGIGNTSAYYRTHISQPKNTTGLFISNNPSTADDYTQIGFGFDTYNVACAAVRAVAENPAGSFNHHLAFHTYNTTLQERMRITSTGNIGIGTTSPNAKLEVRDGDISVSTFNTFSYFNANRLTILSGVGQILGGLRFQAYSTGTTLVTGAQILAYSDEAWTSSTAATYLSFHTTQSGSVTATERMRIFPNGRIGINTTTDAGYQLDVNGGTRVTGRITVTGNDTLGLSVVRAGTSAISSEIYNSGGDNSWMLWGVESSVGGVIFPGSTAYAAVIGQFRNTPLEFFTNNTIRGSFSGAGAFRVHNLAGTGTRVVVADANGVLSTSASAAVTGSGTTNYISKFTAAGVIGDSQIFDNGTNVGIGTASPSFRLDVQSAASTIVRIKGGTGAAQGSAYYQTFAGSTNTMSAFGDRANIFGGTVDQIASIYTGANIPLTFDINATERMRITAGGRVGIGTASPNYFVEAYQNGLSDVIVNSAADNNSAILSVFNSGGTSGNFAQLRAYGNTTASTLFGSSTNKMITLFSNGDALMTIGTISGTPLVFGTSNTERLRITSGGDVGISQPSLLWTATNRRLLELNGTSQSLIGLNVNSLKAGYIWQNGNDMTIATENAGYIQFGTNGSSDRLRIFANGRVGINTTTDAGYQLDVNGSFRASGVIRSGAAVGVTTGFFQLDHPGAQTWKIGVFSDNTSTFSIGNDLAGTFASRYLNITNAGNVGIGTTSPAQRLDVSGVIRANSGTIYAQASGTESSGYQLNAITMGYDAAANIGWVTAGGAAARTNLVLQQSGGNVLIGTATSSGYRLQVSGSIYGSAGIDITQSFFSSGTAAGLYINGTTNGASIQALSQSLTGSNASALFSGGTTWNTTGSPSLIDILVTNTASGASSNFIKISDSTNTFRVTKDAGLITSNPTGGTAKKWKLGSVVSTTVTMVTSQYVEVEIDGTFYRLALVTPA